MHNNHEQLACRCEENSHNEQPSQRSFCPETLNSFRGQVPGLAGRQHPPTAVQEQVRRNWVFQGGTLSGGTDDEERLSDPGWDREKQRRRAGYRVEPQAQGKL